MATLTENLFHGSGEGTWGLTVIDGRWPTDAYGDVFIIGPDKRTPGVARAAEPTFNPPLLLHSHWMQHRTGSRSSSYRVPLAADVWGAIRGAPKSVTSLVRMGRQAAPEMKATSRSRAARLLSRRSPWKAAGRVYDAQRLARH